MHETIRESQMLERVRRWRAEAFEALRGQGQNDRVQHAREWANRLGLPVLEESLETAVDTNVLAPPAPDPTHNS